LRRAVSCANVARADNELDFEYGVNMRATALLIAGTLVVFSAHVGLPYLFVSAGRAGMLPTWIDSITSSTDPALWAILFPAALAFAAYSYVFRHSGIPGLANWRRIRWPAAFAAAFLSLWAEMFVMFNTFGS